MNLTEARQKVGLSREKAAYRLEVSSSTLRAWEKGINSIPSNKLPKLQEVLGLSDTEVLDIIKQLSA